MSDENFNNTPLGQDVGEGIYEGYNVQDKTRTVAVNSAKELRKMVSDIRQEMMEDKKLSFVETNIEENSEVDSEDTNAFNNSGIINTAVEPVDTDEVLVETDENSVFNGVNTQVKTSDDKTLSLSSLNDSKAFNKIQTIAGKSAKVVGVATKVSSVAHKGVMAGMRFGKNANKVINGNGNGIEESGQQIKTFANFVGRNGIRKPATKIGKKVNAKIVKKPVTKAIKAVSKVEQKLINKLANTSFKLINKLITVIIKVIAKIISAIIKLLISSIPMLAAVFAVIIILVVVLSVFGGGMDESQFEKYSTYMQDIQNEFQEETLSYYNENYIVDGTYNGVAYINWQGALSIIQAIQPSIDGSDSEFDLLDKMNDDGLFYTITETTTSKYELEPAVYDDDGNLVKEAVTTTTKYVVSLSSFDDYKEWVKNHTSDIQLFCSQEGIPYNSSMNDSIFETCDTLYNSSDFDLMLQEAGVVYNGSIDSGAIYDTGEHNGVLSYPTSYRNLSAGFPTYPSGAEHTGIDFPCPIGTPVCACADGVVILTKELNYSYGKYIVIQHNINGSTIYTLYAHNSQLGVKVGDQVKQGQVIALSGNTGNSTGAHCHLSVLTSWSPQHYVQPLDYLE